VTALNRRGLLTGAVAASAATALTPFAVPSARAAAPPLGKQNAGWYRYKVGSFEVTVVTDGGNNNPLPDGFVANAQKPEINAALTADFLPPDRVVGTYNPLVVNTGSKLVALDAGLGLGMFEQSKGGVGQFHGNLQASGIDRNAVDAVVITHFHGDHINGLVGPENKPAFPKAEVFVPAAEWAFWRDEAANKGKTPTVAQGQFGNIKRVFDVLGNKVTQYEGSKELVPGITSIPTPGHTPGHMSVLVTSGNDKMIYQADVTAGPATIFLRNPNWHFVFDTDKAMAVETRRKFYEMVVAEKALVQGYHFTFPSRGYIEKSGSGYRFVPAPWSPTI
jgi:glyoxylase-like metal-dependent hydrolase (beta-lactamase superfamily II)